MSLSTSSAGSIYLFKGNSYWKFMFPESSPQDGYPRSTAVDWLDCPDSTLFSPLADDLSSTLSPPGGRQELRARWVEVREGQPSGRWKDRHRNTQLDTRDSHIRRQCTCQNRAMAERTTSVTAALLLGTWTVVSV